VSCVHYSQTDEHQAFSKFAGATKKYYITAAPQCVYPDAALSSVINNANFDAIYVQFCGYSV
jgi:chitinase